MNDGSLWREIGAALRKEIDEGRYGPGQKLPSEAELAKRFSVNRHTVRRALSELQNEGLTYSRRGAGVFVTARPMDYPLGRRVRFHQSLEAAGQTASKTMLRLETVAAAPREAAALELKPGDPVHIWEGIGFADGVPVSLSHSWFPAERLPGFKEAMAETGSVTEALKGEGVTDYIRARTDVSAEAAGSLHSRHLQVSRGAPLLRAVAVNVDPDGRPVEYGRTWFAGDRVKLTVNGQKPL